MVPSHRHGREGIAAGLPRRSNQQSTHILRKLSQNDLVFRCIKGETRPKHQVYLENSVCYYHDSENEVGPFNIDNLNRLLQKRLIGMRTLVC